VRLKSQAEEDTEVEAAPVDAGARCWCTEVREFDSCLKLMQGPECEMVLDL